MKAVQLVAWQTEPELREIVTPSPGPGEVLVKVQAAGLCHSDLHVMDWPEGTLAFELPMTLGHEVAGAVAALGAGAKGFAVGDPVLIYAPWGCGACRACARGADNLCTRRRACSAPLTDAALTPYHALKPHLWRLVPGSSVVVIGVGGLGHVAVQLVRELSPARIVAIDLREHARQVAHDAGADVALDADGLDAGEVRAETGDAGAALVLDFVGSDNTVRLAASVIEVGGHVSIVGSGAESFPCAIGSVPLEWSAGRPSWGTLPELHEVVALARAGRIEIEVEQLALEEAVGGYRRLRRGEVAGRAVVVP